MPSRPHLRSSSASPKPTARVPVPASRAVVDCAVYVEGRRLPGLRTFSHALSEVRSSGTGYVWVGLLSPDNRQMEGVAEAFGLHELVVEDAVQAHQRPKLEQYDDILFLVLKTVKYLEHETLQVANEVVETGEIMVMCGPDFVITVRHGDHTGLAGVRKHLEARPEQLALGPSSVMHAVADHVVDTYVEVTSSIEHDVDAVEENIFSPGRRIEIEPVYLLKREVMELRRAVDPLDLALRRMTSSDNKLVPKEVRRYFRDVQDHHSSVNERIATYDEVLTSLIDAALAKVGIQQNTDMRKISAWVAIASVPTMVAGIYGMNFENIPELQWKYGYYAVLLILVTVCVLLWRTFRKNHWL
ncbi:MAG: magnesium and cobalt transport protein CorA [Gordonia sp.]|uniref:Magnesium transport protein CorA n=1 Tax=Gordonia rubripertincta TaxID=36822 RepID=A0ABT4N0Y2_GORRU|nr:MULTISPECIES: magnesium/cobalt transporter CorA [Mycobacteriales]MBA4026169.1 magnesium and cobalt transport protein CorA [Gordonia sp. (in: high G+C Gram-positive bacteria)]MCZ4552923.1 magnesium/cobalt transporter CorA [Gordonia rubripertincta]OZG30338.1 magnesium and cobalt transport protein CorA [Williamsia sp. 1138]